MKKTISALLIFALCGCQPAYASSASQKKPFPYEQGIALTKNVLYLNARELSAGAGLNTFWSDTFKDSSQINSGTSSGYVARGASDYDVIKSSGGIEQSETTQHSSWDFWRAGTVYSKGAGVVFQATSSYTLASVDFYIGKTGSPTGNLRAKLYALNSQAITAIPSGSTLAQSSLYNVATLSGSQGWVNFTFSTTYNLVSGTWYAVVLEATGAVGDNSNKIAIGESTSNGSLYNGVNADDSLVWTNVASEAAMFRLYEQAPMEAVVRSVTTTLSSSINEAMVFVEMNSGSPGLVRVSANGGTTWKTVTDNLEQVVSLGHSGTSLILEVTFYGSQELEFWGVAA